MDLANTISTLRTRTPEYWLNSANQHLPAWTSAILVVGIAWYTAQFIWALTPNTSEFDWTIRPETAGSQNVSSENNAANYSAIASAHLFGEAGAEPVAPLANTENAPETRLSLKLRGTVAAADTEFAHAIIGETGKGGDKVYFINDKVPGGATLHEVHADKVILNRAGKLESLSLPKLSQNLGNQPQRTRTAATPVTRATPPVAMQQAMEQGGRKSFTDILRPQPYMPNGEMKGYRIYPGRDRRKFASLGFRPGDLVTEINGQRLDNLQNGMSIFKELGSASQLSLTVERQGGAPMTINMDSTQLAEAMRE